MTEPTYEQRVADAKTRIREVTTRDAMRMHAADGALFLDVREMPEWNLFRIPGATHLPLGELDARLGEVPRDRPVVVYCASGNRSALAADRMRELGYPDVASLAGGIKGWAMAGGAVDDS
jgi:rhodanese-related sulfurtransferase